MISLKLALVLLSLSASALSVSVTSSLKPSDRAKFKQIFTASLDSNDVASVYYSVLGLKDLGEAIPKQQAICALVANSLKTTTSVENSFYASSTYQALSNCKETIHVANLIKKFKDVLADSTSSVPDLYFAAQGLKDLNQAVPHTDVVKTIQTALKTDDTLVNLGYVFHIASFLGSNGAFAYNRIEDAIVQADEVDGKFLQFEGGLSITALIINGAYKLGTSLNKAPQLSPDQAIKFANYFLSRRSVQLPKGAYFLLNVLKTLADNKFQIPVVIEIAETATISSSNPSLNVHVSDVLGNALTAPLTVTAESATRLSDNVVVLSKKKLEQTPANSKIYGVNILDAKLDAGLYRVSISAVPNKADPRLIGNVGTTVIIKVTCPVSVQNVQIGIVDSDQTSAPKLNDLVFPTRLGSVLSADVSQRLILKFGLKNKASGKALSVHQAFVKFTNLASQQEITFLAESSSDNNYKFDIDFNSKSSLFEHKSGDYMISLIVGDAILSDSFLWDMAKVQLKFPSDAPDAAKSSTDIYKPKPEIQHLFREPEPRPRAAVSTFFTGLVILPLLILLGLWVKLGVNIKNFPFSLSAVLFHLGLGAIFGLFTLFWLKLNMFETLKYLIGLAIVTFLCGNKMLSHVAANRKR
nr:PREDICTED: dolichyl-diphosphooligosaccharide--protein glycosyltransferase subunit 2 [Bemisia tabaci]